MIMLTKTNELTDAPLDWAVAKCLTLTGAARGVELRDGVPMVLNGCWAVAEFSYNWDQGGPIIEREGICLKKGHSGWWIAKLLDVNDEEHFVTVAPTPLVAAMRCYVASKLGDEVDVPDELMET